MPGAVGRTLRGLLVAVVTVAFLAFAVANRQFVPISFYFLPTLEMPEFLLLLLCFALGAIMGGLTVQCKASRHKRQFKAEQKRNAALSNELQGLQAENKSAGGNFILTDKRAAG